MSPVNKKLQKKNDKQDIYKFCAAQSDADV